MRHKDGSWRWIYARGEVHRDGAGTPVRMLGCHVDITERRRSEHHVRQLNRTYAVLSDINHLIARDRGALTLLEGACRIAVEKGGFLLAWIGLAEPSSSRLEIKAHAGASPETLRIVKSFVEGEMRESALRSHRGGAAHWPAQRLQRHPARPAQRYRGATLRWSAATAPWRRCR